MADEKKVVLLEIDINIESAIQAQKELGAEVVKLKAKSKELADTEGKLSDAYIKNAAQLKAAQAELRKQETLTRKAIEANTAASGSIDQMSAQLSVVNAQWKALSEEERNNSEVGKTISAEKKRLTEQINAEKLALSDTTSNVGNYEESIKSLKLELRENTLALVKMKAAGEDNTEAYKQLLRTTGELSDTIADTREEIKKYASDTMALDQAIGVFKGIGAAAQVAEGAAALLGSENKDLTESIQKMVAIQSVMSGAQEIQNALQKESAFMMGVMSIKTGIVTAAQWLWNAAMTANPIGAIVTGVGALIGLFGAFALAVGGSTDELEKQKAAVSDIEKEYADLQSRLEFQSKINDAIIESEDEKAFRARKGIREQIDALELLNEALSRQRALEGDEDGSLSKRIEDNNNKIIALGDELILNKLSQAKRAIDEEKKANDDANKKAIEDRKRREEEVKKIREQYSLEEISNLKDGNDDIKSEIDELNEIQRRLTSEALSYELEAIQLVIDRRKEADAINSDINRTEIEKLTEDYEKKRKLLEEFGFSTVELERQFAEAKEQIAWKEKAAKLQVYGDIGNALSALGDLAGKKTAEGKLLAIAGATINAYSGIAATLGAPTTIPEPFGSAAKIAQATVIGATAFKAVRDIIKVNVPKSSGGGGSSGSGGVGSSSAPRASYNPEIGKGLVSRDNATGTQSSVASGVQQGINAAPVQPVLVVDAVTSKQNTASNIVQVATY